MSEARAVAPQIIIEAARDPRARLTAGVLAATILLSACGGESSAPVADTNPNASPTSTTTETGKCAPTWDRNELQDNAKHRVLAEGLPVIGKADTKQEAREAVDQWWTVIRGDKEVSAQLAEAITGNDVKESKLFDKAGCATDYADGVNDRVVANLAASTITPGQASKDGYNTGLNDGKLVRNTHPGVSGKRSAAVIALPNGKKFSVMSRCAQPVFEGQPALPVGPTDEAIVTQPHKRGEHIVTTPNKQPKIEQPKRIKTPKQDKATSPAGVADEPKGQGGTGLETARPQAGNAPATVAEQQKAQPLPAPEVAQDGATAPTAPAETGVDPGTTAPATQGAPGTTTPAGQISSGTTPGGE